MKTAIQTACFFLLSFFLFLICPSSCTGEALTDRSAYTKSNFDVRLCGELDGIRIEGILQNRPDATGKSIRALFKFESPDSLRSLTVSVNGEGGMSARLGDLSESSESLLPLADFFLPVIEMGEISSVEKNKDGGVTVRVCDENCDLEYAFSPNSLLPSQIKGKYKGNTLDLSVTEITTNDVEKKIGFLS